MDPEAKHRILRMFSNGIYILTSRSGDQYGGATVTWVSQASFKPPLVMAAVRPGSNVFQCLSESGTAALHVVSQEQCDLAQRFFTTTKVNDGLMNQEPFSLGKTGAPVLEHAAAYLECRVRNSVQTDGDHVVVVLEVVEAEARQEMEPLTVAESPWEYGG
jgi:flavin reductase (DIM6/NTAB) family NADH-FMN oxidoreductase RutF